MTSATNDPGAHLRTNVTRIHAICLFVITIATTIASTIGWRGKGPLNLLASQPFGYVGLYQAYFLMFLLALVSLIGATRWPSRLWNAALLAAHLGPVSIIIIANDVFVATNTQRMAYLVALTIHIPLIVLEVFALVWKAPIFRSVADARVTQGTLVARSPATAQEAHPVALRDRRSGEAHIRGHLKYLWRVQCGRTGDRGPRPRTAQPPPGVQGRRAHRNGGRGPPQRRRTRLDQSATKTRPRLRSRSRRGGEPNPAAILTTHRRWKLGVVQAARRQSGQPFVTGWVPDH